MTDEIEEAQRPGEEGDPAASPEDTVPDEASGASGTEVGGADPDTVVQAHEDGGDPPPEAARDLGPLKEALEALVFVHRGILPPKTVREVLGEEFTAEEITAGFTLLKEEYAQRGGALVLLEVAGGYQFGTRPDLARWIQKLDFYEHHRHLSRPTMETLAIIAYKQPVTRAEIEAIRGVNVERIVRTLIERKIVRILGHKDVPGRPTVLGTTKDFLELFGLNSLADLPPLKDFVEPPVPDEGYEVDGTAVADAVTAGSAVEAAGSGEGEGEHGASVQSGDGGEPGVAENGDGVGPETGKDG